MRILISFTEINIFVIFVKLLKQAINQREYENQNIWNICTGIKTGYPYTTTVISSNGCGCVGVMLSVADARKENKTEPTHRCSCNNQNSCASCHSLLNWNTFQGHESFHFGKFLVSSPHPVYHPWILKRAFISSLTFISWHGVLIWLWRWSGWGSTTFYMQYNTGNRKTCSWIPKSWLYIISLFLGCSGWVWKKLISSNSLRNTRYDKCYTQTEKPNEFNCIQKE